jgi:tRNA uridine 5-carboxymethylaminomethyl modification enzyme
MKKGPAVKGLRAQIDRNLYKKYLKEELFSRPIHFEENSVENLLIEKLENGKLDCIGVILKDGKKLKSKTTIITTGTFLDGLILIGKESFSAGRMGDKASIGLAETFKKLNFKTGRLKTGTPPRIYKDSIDFDETELIEPDLNPEPFSFLNEKVKINTFDQLPCHLVYTDERIEKLVKSNINSSSYIREEARGVRYCPSLEAKVLKFSSYFHQVWLEPESLDSDLIYPNGIKFQN